MFRFIKALFPKTRKSAVNSQRGKKMAEEKKKKKEGAKGVPTRNWDGEA